MRWITQLDGGPRRVNHAAVAIGDLIFSIGGFCTGEDYKHYRPIDIHILNINTLRWIALPVLEPNTSQYKIAPFQRYGHTANAYGHLIYVWGGRNDLRACNKLFCFNTISKEWEKVRDDGRPPGARDGHTSCIIEDKMYIFGGYEEALNQFSEDVHTLNLKTMSWTYVKTRGIPPRRRDFHSVSVLDDNMYIFGGRSCRNNLFLTSDDEIYCNQLMCFNTKSNTWRAVNTNGAKPPGRRSHSSFVFENQLYIFGGYNGIHNVHYNDIYKFNPVSLQWSKVHCNGIGPEARRRQCCCVVGGRLYVFGGTSPIPDRSPRDLYPSLFDSVDNYLIDHCDLIVLDFNPSLKTLCELAVIAYGLDRSCLPKNLQWELDSITTPNTINQWSAVNKAG